MFNEKQAEGIAHTIHEHLAHNVATKDDLTNLGIELRAEIYASIVDDPDWEPEVSFS